MPAKALNQAIDALEIVADQLTYLPSPDQRKVKSAFWVRFNENPLCDPSDITLAMAQSVVHDSRQSKWWSTPGYKEWFRNREEFRERMEYLTNLAMDSLEHILADDRAQSSAKVNAAKLIMEVARKMPPKSTGVEQYLDAKIQEMDKKQLEDFIKKNIKLVVGNPEQLTTDVDPDTLEASN